jgi:hypothetical protein
MVLSGSPLSSQSFYDWVGAKDSWADTDFKNSPLFGKLRQEVREFEANMSYTVRFCLKNKQAKQKTKK